MCVQVRRAKVNLDEALLACLIGRRGFLYATRSFDSFCQHCGGGFTNRLETLASPLSPSKSNFLHRIEDHVENIM